MEERMKQIWTIGHSIRPVNEFINILKSFDIKNLIDVRAFPGSRRYPQYNKENLADTLKANEIKYKHMEGLGGRRKPLPDSENIAWRNDSFRGYADYMKSDSFKLNIQQLEEIATTERTVYMCSEAVWWHCHRALISDYLKVKGWEAQHIMSENKSTEHPFTSPAKIIQGKLFYQQAVARENPK